MTRAGLICAAVIAALAVTVPAHADPDVTVEYGPRIATIRACSGQYTFIYDNRLSSQPGRAWWTSSDGQRGSFPVAPGEWVRVRPVLEPRSRVKVRLFTPGVDVVLWGTVQHPERGGCPS